jgi:pimeloyl-ACP methyl ester carboxylesterase
MIMQPTWIDIAAPKLQTMFSRLPVSDSASNGIRFTQLATGMARYRIVGDAGPVLIWLPDPPVVIEHYAMMAERLSDHFQVIWLELPGIGCSRPPWSLRFSLSTVAASILEFVDRLQLDHVNLVATCLSGYAAQLAANLMPDRFNRIIFLQTPSWQDGQQWRQARDPKYLLRCPYIGQLLSQAMKYRRLKNWFEMALADRSHAENYSAIATAALRSGGNFCLPSLFQDYLSPDQAIPASVTQHALALYGKLDRSHRHTDWSNLGSLALRLQTQHIAEAGHFPDLEQPQKTIDVLLKFFAE